MANAAETAVQAQQVAKASPLQSMLPIIMIFAVFYLFIIRPQSKKYKEQQLMLTQSKVGDEVVVLNGIFGRISAINSDETCEVEISKGNNIKIFKTAIVKNITNEEAKKKK